MKYFTEAIEKKNSIEHHGILGQKWGRLNGPPYPLDKGDHSASEKSAAAAAGVKVGSSSGKGSIANVKKSSGSVSKSPRKVLTEEEKREEALKAVKTGDKKKISKYMDQLSTQELFDAENRARIKSNLNREEPGEKKATKADLEKMEVIRSGDKQKIREYADKLSYQELSEAMNRVDLNTKLYYEKPAPTALDKFSDAMDKVNKVRVAAEKGIAAYNTLAKVYNSTHKDGTMWPEIQAGLSLKNNKEAKKEQDILDKLVNKAAKDVKKGVKDTQEQKEQAQAKAEAKAEKKAAKEQTKLEKEQAKEEAKQKKYSVERSPKLKEKETKEPTEEQKQLVEEARKSDDSYLSRMNSVTNNKMSDYDDFDYSSIFSESYMKSQRDMSFNKAMESFDYDDWRDNIRWSDF